MHRSSVQYCQNKFKFIYPRTRYKYASSSRDSISNYVIYFFVVRDSGWIGKIRLESGKILDMSRIFPIFPEVSKVSETEKIVRSCVFFRAPCFEINIHIHLFTFERSITRKKNIFLIDSIRVCFHVWIRNETNRASLSTMCWCGQLDEGPGRKTHSRPSACKTHLASGIASGLCNSFPVSLYRSCYL